MRKHTIIFIVFLIIAALGVLWYQGALVQQQAPPRDVAESAAKSTPEQKAGDIIKTKDASQCAKVGDAYWETICQNNIAFALSQEKLDISYCQKLDDKLMDINSCVRQTLFAKSLAQEDVSVCEETQNKEIQTECKDNFYPTLALRSKDIKLCDEIQDKTKSNLCHDNFLLQTVFQNEPLNFDCSLFVEKDAKEDCKLYKKDLNEQTDIRNRFDPVCAQMTSRVFQSYCLL